MYDTADEAKQKLQGSVVLFDGKPVDIVQAEGKKNKISLIYRKIPIQGEESESESIDDPRWDFKSAGTKLGYTIVQNPVTKAWSSVFTSRIPIRSSRQGLDNKTVMIQGIQLERERSGYSYSWGDLITRNDGLVRTIRGQFLGPKGAFDRVMKEYEEFLAIPIHRKIVLAYDCISPPYIIYRNEKVGYTEDGLTFKLAKHKEYLREELVDMVGLKVA